MPNSEPIVVRVAREFKAGLLAREDVQIAEMARRWLGIEAALDGQMTALAEEIATMRATGQTVTAWKLYRMDRYKSLLAQAKIEIQRYTDAYALPMIQRSQAEYIQLGLYNAEQTMMAAAADAGIRVAFDRLPVGALEAMIGAASDGSPFRDLLAQSWPDAVDGLTQALIDGIAGGWNPRKTATAMKNGFGVGLERARVIAQDQQLRAYRTATTESYRASGVVKSYRRLASKSGRTCLACLARDGEIIPLGTEMWDHVGGHCTQIAVLIDAPPLEWQTGAEWFKSLPAAQQREMMDAENKGLYEAWRAGQFDFTRLAKVTHDDTWGRGLEVRRLKELVQ